MLNQYNVVLYPVGDDFSPYGQKKVQATNPIEALAQVLQDSILAYTQSYGYVPAFKDIEVTLMDEDFDMEAI